MEQHTLLLVGFVVLAAAVFVTARVVAVAIGVLPDATDAGGTRDAKPDGGDRTDEDVATARDDTDGWETSRITAADRERMRKHLEKDPLRRSPDDLLPSDSDGETE
jgi:hypothetical protein